jgi:hypothetical protein
MFEISVTAGGMSALILEVVKYIIRTFILKNSEYDFPQKFYLIAIPTLNVAVIPLLALLEISGFTMPTDWMDYGRTIIQVLISSLVSIVAYKYSIKTIKNYKPNEVPVV